VRSCSLDRPACFGDCFPVPALAGACPEDAVREGGSFSPASFGLIAAPGVAAEFMDSSFLAASAGFPVSSAKILGTRRKEVTANVAILRAPNFTVAS